MFATGGTVWLAQQWIPVSALRTAGRASSGTQSVPFRALLDDAVGADLVALATGELVA